MARRKETLTIPGVRSEHAGERDNGKTFVLTEMDAYSGQDWARRGAVDGLGGPSRLRRDGPPTGALRRPKAPT